MYYPSRYEEHNVSLKKFSELFNQTNFKGINSSIFEKEKYIHDAWFDLWGVQINFDWQKSFLWKESAYPFPHIQSFERKFSGFKKIHLFIECHKDENYFAVAWKKDFGDPLKLWLKTENGFENGFVRRSTKFKVFKYSDMHIFKCWLLNTYPLDAGKLSF